MVRIIDVGRTEDISPGQMKRIESEGVDLLLARVDGRFYACQDRCGHQNAPLSMGKLDGKRVTCPLHAAVFDITTGKNIEGIKLAAPQGVELPKEITEMFARTMQIVQKVKIQPLKTYPVKVEDGRIKILMD